MFDPTAFENMKVVLEGAMYDKEFSGEALVTNRKDIVNLSNLSRQYEIEISSVEIQSLQASILLEADIENLASEILGNPDSVNSLKAGCTAAVSFTLPFIVDKEGAAKLIDSLEAIWGKKRVVTVSGTVQYSNAAGPHTSYSQAAISFGRLITEEQMDDLLTMADYMVETLSMLGTLNGQRK